jgi:hypothetical protein
MNYSDETIQALAELRGMALGQVGMSGKVAWLINTLDNAGVFAALDEQAETYSAEEILVEVARRGPVVLPMTGSAPVPARRLEKVEGTLVDPHDWLRRTQTMTPRRDPMADIVCQFGPDCGLAHPHRQCSGYDSNGDHCGMDEGHRSLCGH